MPTFHLPSILRILTTSCQSVSPEIAAFLVAVTSVTAQDGPPDLPAVATRIVESEPVPDRINHWLEGMDANADGKLARKETSGLMNRFFDRNDNNRDGILDPSELRSLGGQLAARGQRPQTQGENNQQRRLKDPSTEPDRGGSSQAWPATNSRRSRGAQVRSLI